jgi:exonuclease VII small subunit
MRMKNKTFEKCQNSLSDIHSTLKGFEKDKLTNEDKEFLKELYEKMTDLRDSCQKELDETQKEINRLSKEENKRGS